MSAVADIVGSHSVDTAGDKVTIKAVPLFCAYHPQFDAADNKGIRYYSNERTSEIIRNTKARIRRGQYPRVVLRHDRPGRIVDPTAIGRVSDVWEMIEDDVVYMYGNLEVSRSAFDAHILTDNYPRRSAEFEPSTLDFLTNVALLGREAPGRPLPDTRFAFESSQISLERPLTPIRFRREPTSDHEFSGIGGGANTYIPGPTKDKHMDDTIKAIHESIGSMQKTIHESFERFEGRIAKLESYCSDPKNMHDSDGDGADDTAVDAGETKRRGRPPKKASDPNFVPRSQFDALSTRLDEEQEKNAALHERVSDFEIKWRRAAATQLVDNAINQGFRFKEKRTEIIGKLSTLDEKAALAEFEMLKSIAGRDPVGDLPIFAQLGNAQSGFPEEERPLTDAQKMKASDKAVAIFEAKQANGEKTTYEACLEEARKAIRAGA